jgi:hypothetical protein
MAEEAMSDEAAGAAIASFALVQIMFWQLIREGVIAKPETVEMLRRKIEVSRQGDRHHRIAAAKLAALFHLVEAYEAPEPLLATRGANALQGILRA